MFLKLLLLFEDGIAIRRETAKHCFNHQKNIICIDLSKCFFFGKSSSICRMTMIAQLNVPSKISFSSEIEGKNSSNFVCHKKQTTLKSIKNLIPSESGMSFILFTKKNAFNFHLLLFFSLSRSQYE